MGTAEVVAAMAAMGSPEAITTGRKFARLVLRVATIAGCYNNNRGCLFRVMNMNADHASTQATASKLTGPGSQSGEQGVRKTSA